MNKQIVILVLGVIVLVVAYAYLVHDSALAGCQVPNGNSVLCYSPNNSVSTCSGRSNGDCNGKVVYSIANFPDGTEDADEGRTKEEMADCYSYQNCAWNTDKKCCEASKTYGPNQKAKTVAKSDDEIGDDDDCKPGE